MSDANSKLKVILARRIVAKAPGSHDQNYYVWEWVDGEGFSKPVSKGYPHSTSAYAKLGRLVNEDSQKDL